MSAAEIVWWVLGFGLIAYALTAGADFGAGFWEYFAVGEAREDQAAIEHAIAPIWEANHIWLIFEIVILFTAFPRAFAAISIALHVPLTLALFGIVLRGSAFVFRAYGLEDVRFRRVTGQVFAFSSVVTPILLGVSLGAIASGQIAADGQLDSVWTPFTLSVGIFTLALFALLAAVYLAADTDGPSRARFRRRALVMEGIAFALAMTVLYLARKSAPTLFESVFASPRALLLQSATFVCASTTLVCLLLGRMNWARLAAAAQVALVVAGFGASLRGQIVPPALDLAHSGARPEVLAPLLPALAAGALLVLPSLWYLFRVFKGGRTLPRRTP